MLPRTTFWEDIVPELTKLAETGNSQAALAAAQFLCGDAGGTKEAFIEAQKWAAMALEKDLKKAGSVLLYARLSAAGDTENAELLKRVLESTAEYGTFLEALY